MTIKWNILSLALFAVIWRVSSVFDVWNEIDCNEDYIPEDCIPKSIDLLTVDAFDRCGPAYLKKNVRNYFLGASGRRLTYKDNKDAFSRIKIVSRLLHDVSHNQLNASALGIDVDFPIGVSPVALHKLAHPDGEIATVRGLSNMRTILILSSFASTLIEDVAKEASGNVLQLWMQVYLYSDRRNTLDLVRRAEMSGFKGIVVTVDAPVHATLTCDARGKAFTERDKSSIKIVNVNVSITGNGDIADPSSTFADITWLKSETSLPIIVKGILTGEDATRAVLAGASAILVSNHGGRQMDGTLATIDALPNVVAAVKKLHPRREVYMDGGVRSGHDVYKAIARGANMVFVGRPIIWGLSLGGLEGVKRMMSILIRDFNQTMIISGASKPSEITGATLLPIVNKG